MIRSSAITLAGVFLKMHLRDRQAIVFSLFFPIALMVAFGLSGGDPDLIELGLVDESRSEWAAEFTRTLNEDPLFRVTEGSEQELRTALIEGDFKMVLILPAELQDSVAGTDLASGTRLRLLVDVAQQRELSLLMPLFEKALVAVERQLRNVEPMFSLTIEDVKARSQGYLDFLIPGLLAFTLMQISIAGSGFNIVEYRRKGILKRLFVTPLQPRDFILGLVLARLLLCLVQLSVLIAVAVWYLQVTIVGSLATLYLVIVLGTVIFLSMGFCLGSIAKTQQAILAIGNLFIFPQMLLSGIFFPIDSLPELIRPLAGVLPLSFVANALRGIFTDGLSLLEVLPELTGIVVWLVIGFVLATRLFVWKEVAN